MTHLYMPYLGEPHSRPKGYRFSSRLSDLVWGHRGAPGRRGGELGKGAGSDWESANCCTGLRNSVSLEELDV